MILAQKPPVATSFTSPMLFSRDEISSEFVLLATNRVLLPLFDEMPDFLRW